MNDNVLLLRIRVIEGMIEELVDDIHYSGEGATRKAAIMYDTLTLKLEEVKQELVSEGVMMQRDSLSKYSKVVGH